MEKENFNVGDEVFINKWPRSIEKIVRETKTRFYTKNYAFYKDDNTIVGDRLYKVVKATQEHFDIFKKERIVINLNRLDFNILNLSTLKDIYKLTKHLDIPEKERIAKHLNKVKFNTLNLDILEKIYKLTKK